MTDTPISLVDRAGLDRQRLAKIISRGLDGADDGELFLEYRQAEALAFDNGRLKQATYDTSQGFGLRAVKDEAVGYAYASDVSEGAIERAADAVRAVKGGYCGHYAAPPSRSNVKLYGEDSPLQNPSFEAKAQLLQTIDAYARAKDPRVRQVTASIAASWQAVEILRTDGEAYRDIRPMVRVNVSVVVGDGNRQETGSDGYGGPCPPKGDAPHHYQITVFAVDVDKLPDAKDHSASAALVGFDLHFHTLGKATLTGVYGR